MVFHFFSRVLLGGSWFFLVSWWFSRFILGLREATIRNAFVLQELSCKFFALSVFRFFGVLQNAAVADSFYSQKVFCIHVVVVVVVVFYFSCW